MIDVPEIGVVRMRKLLPLLLVFMLVLAACGGDDDDDDDGGNGGGAADAETCEDLGQAFLDEMQVLLDELSDMSLEEVSGDEQPEAVTNFENSAEEFGDRADDLGCSDEEMATILQDNIDQLEADGPVPELVLESVKQGIESGEIFEDPTGE